MTRTVTRRTVPVTVTAQPGSRSGRGRPGPAAPARAASGARRPPDNVPPPEPEIRSIGCRSDLGRPGVCRIMPAAPSDRGSESQYNCTMASIQLLSRVMAFLALVGLCHGFSVLFQGSVYSNMRQPLPIRGRSAPATVLFAKSKKSKPKDKGSASTPKQESTPVPPISQSSSQSSAQAASKAAESFNLFEGDKEEQSRISQNRIDKFDRELRDVVARQKTTQELDTRGTRLEGTGKSDSLDDSKIRDLLLGKAKPEKQEKKDRLRTETGVI